MAAGALNKTSVWLPAGNVVERVNAFSGGSSAIAGSGRRSRLMLRVYKFHLPARSYARQRNHLGTAGSIVCDGDICLQCSCVDRGEQDRHRAMVARRQGVGTYGTVVPLVEISAVSSRDDNTCNEQGRRTGICQRNVLRSSETLRSEV
jgi:hypothetical protein